MTHMYGTLGEIWLGLRKNAFALLDYRLSRYVTTMLVWTTMAWVPLLALTWGLVARAGPRQVRWGSSPRARRNLGQAAITLPFVVVMEFPLLYSVSLPLGISLYLAIISASVWRHRQGQITWKGVTYAASEVKTAGLWGRGRADGARRAGEPEGTGSGSARAGVASLSLPESKDRTIGCRQLAAKPARQSTTTMIAMGPKSPTKNRTIRKRPVMSEPPSQACGIPPR